jgi:hypothetical protein
MTTKDILLLVLILAMVAIIFCLNYFLGCPIHALQKAVALDVVSLPPVLKFAAVIGGIHFLK